MLGLRVLYKARPIQPFQQLLTMLHKLYQPLSLVFAVLLLFVVCRWQHCQIRYQDAVLGDYRRHLAVVLLKQFELIHCFHTQLGKCQDFRCLYQYLRSIYCQFVSVAVSTVVCFCLYLKTILNFVNNFWHIRGSWLHYISCSSANGSYIPILDFFFVGNSFPYLFWCFVMFFPPLSSVVVDVHNLRS